MFADQRARIAVLLDEKLRPGRAARIACGVVGLVLIVAGARTALGAVRGE